MTDEQDGHSLLLELLNDLEKAVHFAAGDGRGRFVHHQNPRVDRERFGNLDRLALGDTEDLDRHADIDFHAQTR